MKIRLFDGSFMEKHEIVRIVGYTKRCYIIQAYSHIRGHKPGENIRVSRLNVMLDCAERTNSRSQVDLSEEWWNN